MENQDEEYIITITYKIREEDKNKINIFHSNFVENNKDKCKIIYKEKEYELKNEFKINDKDDMKKDFFLIKLKGLNNITDASYMFYGCKTLISLSNITNWDTSNINNFGKMFFNCNSLISLPDISNWNTSNVTNMSGIFYRCNSLTSLPDISKWDISNVTSLYAIFYGCNSLISLPDISKWNTENVISIEGMFYDCNSLISLPDLTNWSFDLDYKECLNCLNIFPLPYYEEFLFNYLN